MSVGVSASWRSGGPLHVSSFLVCGWGHLLLGLVQGQTAARVLGPGLAFWDNRETASDGAGAWLSPRLRWLSPLLWAQPPVSKLCLAWSLTGLPGQARILSQRALPSPTLPSPASRLEAPCKLRNILMPGWRPRPRKPDVLGVSYRHGHFLKHLGRWRCAVRAGHH